jgi:predicted N-formylglutamate amidohydrolase
MSDEASKYRLLEPDEPPAFSQWHPDGQSSFVIVVDHASNRIPRRLAGLGLSAAELQRHIAWDIGCLGVARQVAAALDAPLIAQNYSRLLIDCNRPPGVESAIPTESEWTSIPGNLALTTEQANARRTEIFNPYHERVQALLDARLAAGRPTIMVAQHSMTDSFKGVRRGMHAAILYNRDRRFAGLMLDMLRREQELVVGDNDPYFVSDETDYTVPHHAEKRGLPYVEIEIRQDLILDERGQSEWARRIVRALQDAEDALLNAE